MCVLASLRESRHVTATNIAEIFNGSVQTKLFIVQCTFEHNKLYSRAMGFHGTDLNLINCYSGYFMHYLKLCLTLAAVSGGQMGRRY